MNSARSMLMLVVLFITVCVLTIIWSNAKAISINIYEEEQNEVDMQYFTVDILRIKMRAF